eukprot:m.17565 g.17565  ORF g.17565 m.17565 type:complete len:108 (+) comp3255_c0_seq1:538-861(+)
MRLLQGKKRHEIVQLELLSRGLQQPRVDSISKWMENFRLNAADVAHPLYDREHSLLRLSLADFRLVLQPRLQDPVEHDHLELMLQFSDFVQSSPPSLAAKWLPPPNM